MASLPCRWGVPLGFAVLLTVLWGLVAPALATETAGTVLAVNPNAFTERAGGRVPLAVKEAVYVGDTLTTDATGRVRILLRDDTALSLGSNTNFVLETFTPGGNKPRFSGSMIGIARILTGRIAKEDPDGVIVNTSLAVVGIRGTICTIHASHEFTIVYVGTTQREVVVNGASVKSAQKALVRTIGGKPEISPIHDVDRLELRRLLSINRRRPQESMDRVIARMGTRNMAPVTTAPIFNQFFAALHTLSSPQRTRSTVCSALFGPKNT